ncbi:MAG: hypothetical protein ABIR31_11480 [Ginsengibacter sp.]
MKKYPFFILAILLIFANQLHSFAINVSPHSFIEVKIIERPLFARDVVKMNAKEFSIATGHQLNFIQKIYFKILKSKLKTTIKNDNDLLLEKYYEPKKGKFKFDSLWFIIGSIIGPLGILFAFTSKQPKNKRLSAVLGTIVFIIWFSLLTLL